MRSSYFSEYNRRVNEYKACLNKANSLYNRFQENHMRSTLLEAIRCQKDATEMCGELAGMFDRNDPQCVEWLGKQANHERKLGDLLDIYEHGIQEPSAADESVPTTKAPAKPLKEKEQKAGSSGKSAPDGVSQEMVNSWFKERPSHNFDAVAGMDELKEKLRACVQDVAASRVNEYLGMEVVHSFFLYGPPGCGKTFVTQAFIHELMADNYSYMFLSGGDVHQALVGMSEKVVERAFKEAQEHAPCILFIDEIDSVCRNRSMQHLPVHAMNTTTAFLNGYNSLLESKKPVIFIGATNYPNMVEGAMLDRVELIKVPLPDLEVRTFTFEKALSKILGNEPGFTYADMAEETDNYSQRDCKRLISLIKRAVKDDLRNTYGSDADAMVDAMQSKKYLLTRRLFMDALKKCNPSRKEEMIRTLDQWEADSHKDDE